MTDFMQEPTRVGGWNLAFEILTLAITLSFLTGIKFRRPEALLSNRLIPRGTVLTVLLDSPISSQTAYLGKPFYGRILSAQGATNLSGARVVGRCAASHDRELDATTGYLRLALSGLIDSKGNVSSFATNTLSFWGQCVTNSQAATEVLPAATNAPTELPSRPDDAVHPPGEQLGFVMLRPAVVAQP